MERLKRRTDFKAAARGARAPAGAFVLQGLRRDEDGRDGGRQNAAVRVGFTVSRQVGNAVERNRVRRRLREMVRLAPAASLRPGYDYVLIGRRAALAADFADMTRQFGAAIRRIHAAPPTGQGDQRDTRPATGGGRHPPPHRAGPRPGGDSRRGERRHKSGPRSDEHESR
jgi:ribonuclease P protein component